MKLEMGIKSTNAINMAAEASLTLIIRIMFVFHFVARV